MPNPESNAETQDLFRSKVIRQRVALVASSFFLSTAINVESDLDKLQAERPAIVSEIPEPGNTELPEEAWEPIHFSPPVPARFERLINQDFEELRDVKVLNEYYFLISNRREDQGLPVEEDLVPEEPGSLETGMLSVPTPILQPLRRAVEAELHYDAYFVERFGKGIHSKDSEIADRARRRYWDAVSGFSLWADGASVVPPIRGATERLAEITGYERTYLLSLRESEERELDQARAAADALYGPMDHQYDSRGRKTPPVTAEFDTPEVREAQTVALEFWQSRGHEAPCADTAEPEVQISNVLDPEVVTALASFQECRVVFRAGAPAELSRERFEQVMIHEYGHLFGLEHTEKPGPMHGSTKPPRSVVLPQYEAAESDAVPGS